MEKRAGLIAAVVLSAVALGAVAAQVVSRAPGESSKQQMVESAAPTPMAGSGQLVTDAADPTPILPTIPPNPATPPPLGGEGPAAPWLEGRYRVRFTMKADSCGEHVSPREHELVVRRLESWVRIEDTFTGSVLEGPATQDGAFRVESSNPLVPGSRREFRQVMTGKASPDGISGDYFVYPAIRDCAVQLGFEGPKVS